MNRHSSQHSSTVFGYSTGKWSEYSMALDNNFTLAMGYLASLAIFMGTVSHTNDLAGIVAQKVSKFLTGVVKMGR